MKILWLYASMPGYDGNHWYHLDFAKIINQQKNTDLLVYGYNLKKVCPELAPISFDVNITAKDLKKDFNFDTIVMDNRYRFFKNPKKWDSSKFFNKLNGIPKIMIEGDFHFHKNEYLKNVWFLPNEIDLILHRHYINLLLGTKIIPKIKQLWFPCSVDDNIFKPNPLIKRENLICSLLYGFAPKVYPYRNLVAKKLKENKMAKVIGCCLSHNRYITCLQSYVAHINGSSIYNINNAKMFEIMASGSVLLTDESNNNGLKYLFPYNSYCTYKRDGSDIIEKTKKIIHEPDYRKYITDNAIDCIKSEHSHVIRAKELIGMIEKRIGK